MMKSDSEISLSLYLLRNLETISGWNPMGIDLGEMVVSSLVYVLGRVRFALIGVKFLNYELTPKCFIKIN